MLLKLVVWSFVVGYTTSHVALKYPPARKYDLDFLDSFRTGGECGMAVGSERTQFLVGEQINVTWHLGYPHGGGIKLQILRAGEEPEDLLSDWQDQDRFQQSNLITLPTTPCQECTLRLLRQATEWGQRYQFRSCADISLLAVGQSVAQPCGQHGQLNNGECLCEAGYSGDRCQYWSECTTDADCNGQGKCELLSNALHEEKACFCQSGSFGPRCEKSSDQNSNARTYDDIDFNVVDLGDDGDKRVLWRVVEGGELVEIVAEFTTESWVGVGWRPADAAKSCQRFPSDALAPRGTDFHAMDCTDIVIGFSKNGRGWIRDFYTRDRSTPRLDSFWGGEDDLEAGDVWEQDGKTIMRFVKKIKGGTADHDFQGKLHMIWATGQQQDQFYKNDQLKYHGRQQRGIFQIDGPELVGKSLHPATIGIIIACSLLGFLFILQICQRLMRN